MIALGDKAVQDLSYYSSIHQKAEESSFEREMTMPILLRMRIFHQMVGK